ncbi:MAG: hypothetical protein IPI67_31485 [Myxococcales bacterium]|nr:hypothetical protein [Myxococcales bacterium]
MVEILAVLGLAAACALWVLIDRASGGCGNSGRCGACGGGGGCSRDPHEDDGPGERASNGDSPAARAG